jgi:hypothetical protein
MNKIQYAYFVVLLVLFSACELDNYDAPSAELYGTFIDEGTDEPLQSEIVQGTVIQLIEHGWVENQTNITQSLVVENDGSYRNTMIFPGSYRVTAAQGNFQPSSPIEKLEIKGRTQLDFLVTPYLRIRNASIVKSGTKVIASFTIEKTTADDVARIALFSHPNVVVGANTSLVKIESTSDLNSDPDKVHTLEIDLQNPNFISGRSYYFRIGALSSVTGARFNFSAPVNIPI